VKRGKGELPITKQGPHRRKSRRCVAVQLEGGITARVQTNGGEISPRTREALQALTDAAVKRWTTSTRPCAVPGCPELVGLDRLTCKPHWYELVPEHMRERFKPDMGNLDRAYLYREIRHLLTAPARRPCLVGGGPIHGQGCKCLHFDRAECPETGADLTTCECGHEESEHKP